jgi:hypothetical protein
MLAMKPLPAALRRLLQPGGGSIRAALLLLPLTLLTASGCEQPLPPEGVTTATVTDDELPALWDSALSVLQKFEFQPARQDRAMGVIETLPMTSRQWGELWRQDVPDRYGQLESSLHTMQRKVTVRFIHGESGWNVEVQADVYRLSMPESQITTASSAIQSFTGSLPTSEGQRIKEFNEAKRWVLLGRDPELEAHLLDRILAGAGR